MLFFKVHRNVDDSKARKIAIELWKKNEDGSVELLDKCRVFGLLGGILFERRLVKRKELMLKRAKVMLAHSVEVEK